MHTIIKKEKKVKNKAGPHPPLHFSVYVNRGVCSMNNVPLRELSDSCHSVHKSDFS